MASRAGKHGQASKVNDAAGPTDPSASLDDAAMLGVRLRKVALGLTLALVIGRAYWPAEGTDELTSGAGLSWTFALLWTALLAVVGAFLERSLRFRVSWADAAVVGLVGLVGWSTTGALDRRIAINLAWQWGGLGLAYLLLRNLPRTRGESRAIAGCLVATAVAVSVYGYYQAGVELPAEIARFEKDPRAVLRDMGEPNVEPGTPEFERIRNRLVESKEPFSTFALANSLAGYLVGPLVLGAAVLLIGLGKREDATEAGSRPVTATAPILAAVPWLLMLVMLLLTKSRSAWLGFGIGVLIVAATLGPRLGRRLVFRGVVGLVVVGGIAGAVLWKIGYLDRGVLTQATLSLRYRFEFWAGTWRALVETGGWRGGFGPGNLRFWYMQFKSPTASEDIADPHNLVLDAWATAGIGAAFLLVVGLVLVCWNLFGRSTVEAAAPLRPASWDRWLTGWAGPGGWFAVVLLGHISLFSTSDEPLIRWLFLGGGWALAALMAGPLWERVRLPAVGFGAAVVAMVVNLTAAGGIGYASVASMLWGLAAAGLNLRDDRPCGRLRELPGYGGPVGAGVVLAAVIGLFFGGVLPFWSMQAAMRQADAQLMRVPGNPPQDDLTKAAELLDQAIAADAYSTQPYIDLAGLEFLAWRTRGAAPEDAVWNRIETLLEKARTRPRNPLSLSVRRARVTYAELILRQRPDLPEPVRDRLRFIIADASYTIADTLNPTSPIDHARAALALAAVDRYDVAVRQADEALRLDRLTPHVDKKLLPDVRKSLKESLDDWRAKAEAMEAESTAEE